MNDYLEVRYNVSPCNEVITDIIAAILADRGYESLYLTPTESPPT